MLMSELKYLGRLLTVFILLVFYGTGWMITIAYLRGDNDEIWCYITAILWILAHLIGLAFFILWSWSLI